MEQSYVKTMALEPMTYALLHWGLDKIADILQATFSMHLLKDFLFISIQISLQFALIVAISIGSDNVCNVLAPTQADKRQAFIWTKYDSIHWHIYVSSGIKELADTEFKQKYIKVLSSWFTSTLQGSFFVCAQPMRDDVTMYILQATM